MGKATCLGIHRIRTETDCSMANDELIARMNEQLNREVTTFLR